MHHKSIAAFAAVIAIATHGADGAEREAGTYPARPIRLMVPQNAGASVDNVSRILAAKMGEELGQQIVADNRAGAGGTRRSGNDAGGPHKCGTIFRRNKRRAD